MLTAACRYTACLPTSQLLILRFFLVSRLQTLEIPPTRMPFQLQSFLPYLQYWCSTIMSISMKKKMLAVSKYNRQSYVSRHDNILSTKPSNNYEIIFILLLLLLLLDLHKRRGTPLLTYYVVLHYTIVSTSINDSISSKCFGS